MEHLAEVCPAVADAFSTYRDTWGWRPVNYDPGSPALAERPALLARQVLESWERGRRPSDAPDGRDAQVARARAALDPDARTRFDDLLEAASRVYPLREENVLFTDNLPCGLIRRILLEAGRRLHRGGFLLRPEDAPWLRGAELRDALSGGPASDLARLPARRRAEYAWVRAHPGPDFLGPPPVAPPDFRGLPRPLRRINGAMLWIMDQELVSGARAATAGTVTGLPLGGGRHKGPVRLIAGEADFGNLRPGDVLVCRITTPAWAPLFAVAGAVVTDGGSLLSHTAIVAREHGLPAVIATGNATTELPEGGVVTVDGDRGTVVSDPESA